MKIFYLLFFCSLLQYQSGYCQIKKLFTKTTNSWYEMDFYGNRISPIYFDEGQRFEVFFDKGKSKGYILVTEFSNNKRHKMSLKTMYTRIVNGDKVYFFQSSDDGSKISLQSEINGICICSYAEKICTTFFNE
jgi:hypothetical protein